MISSKPEATLLHKHGLHLVLLVAFVLTALLVLQQQRTIESQRTLIHQLFNDSLELSQIRMATISRTRR
jgi:hypothetical protein